MEELPLRESSQAQDGELYLKRTHRVSDLHHSATAIDVPLARNILVAIWNVLDTFEK